MALNFILLFSMFSIIVAFIIQRKHMLMTLLYLESMILTLTFIVLYNFSFNPHNNPQMFIVMLTFGACEASLGLALLVSATRQFGSDKMNILSINKC